MTCILCYANKNYLILYRSVQISEKKCICYEIGQRALMLNARVHSHLRSNAFDLEYFP